MEDSFRIIAPTYPAVTTMVELADGLAGLLRAEGITQAHVLAGSFGGMVAQVFMRRYPKLTGRVVLSTTAAPNAELAERYRQQVEMLRAAPPELVASVSKPSFLQMIAPPEAESAFWRGYVDELFSERLSKEDQISTALCLLDFVENYRLSPDDMKDWAGRILILESEDDATFDAAARDGLRALYPAALVHTFANAGHSPGTTQRDTFFAIVRTFFESGRLQP